MITSIIKCWVKLLIHSQSSVVAHWSWEWVRNYKHLLSYSYNTNWTLFFHQTDKTIHIFVWVMMIDAANWLANIGPEWLFVYEYLINTIFIEIYASSGIITGWPFYVVAIGLHVLPHNCQHYTHHLMIYIRIYKDMYKESYKNKYHTTSQHISMNFPRVSKRNNY